MSRRTEPFPEYPIFIRQVKPNNSWLIIIIIIVVLLVITACIVIYAIFRNTATSSIGRCEPGLCVITLATGVKNCPSSNTQQLTYDIVLQDCTSANYCQSTKAPCAVLAGGTLNCAGVCGPDNPSCNCQKKPV